MKKIFLVIFLLLCLFRPVNASLTIVDDFNRADSQTLSDATHHWSELQTQGEASITGNQVEWAVTNPTADFYQVIYNQDRVCNYENCVIQFKIGTKTGSSITTGSNYGNGIVLMRNMSDYVPLGSTNHADIHIRKGFYANGTVTLGVPGGSSTNWTTSTQRTKDTTGEEVKLTFYKSGTDYMLDVCWGAVGDPCAVATNNPHTVNLTTHGVTNKYGYPALFMYDGTTGTNTWWWDDFKIESTNQESLTIKPWMANLKSNGVTVHTRPNTNASDVVIQYGTSPILSSYSETTASTPAWADFLLTKNVITGLNANTKYYYRVQVGNTVDSNIYSFTTLPTAGTATNFRFGELGCYSNFNNLTDTFSSASILESYNPLFVIATGDNGYFSDNEDLWWTYDKIKMMHKVDRYQNLRSVVPFYFGLSDHDVSVDEAIGVLEYIHYTTGTVSVNNGSTSVTGVTGVWNTTNIPRTGHAGDRYATGTASVTNGSAVVNFTGATSASWVDKGDSLSVGTTGINYQILSVSKTGSTLNSVTLTANYNETTGSNKDYMITQPKINFSVDGNKFYKVQSIDSDTTLTLAKPFHEATVTNGTYEIRKGMYNVERYLPLYNDYTPAVGYDSNAQYYSFQVGRVKFWVLDQVKYSSDSSDTEGPNKRIISSLEYNWLVETMQNDSAPLKVLVMPEPFWGDRDPALQTGEHYNYTNYEYDKKHMRSLLSATTGKVLILSGDSHLNMWTYVDALPHVFEVNATRANRPPGNVITQVPQHRSGWWNRDLIEDDGANNGFALIDVTDNGTDVNAEIKIIKDDGTILSTVNFGTSTKRSFVCDYDTNLCPVGRSVTTRTVAGNRTSVNRTALP